MTRRLCLVTALLTVGSAWATPSGKKWFKLPVGYKVHAHTQINGIANFQSTALPVIQSGVERWTRNNVACTKWEVLYQGTFSTPTGLAALNPNDKQNHLIWLGGAAWRHGTGTLGVTHTISLATGQIVDADIEFNNNIVWKIGVASAVGADVESIVAHESGHALGLNHTPSLSAVMYPSYSKDWQGRGEIKTKLSAADINDVCTVYPSQIASGGQGDSCQQDSDCTTGAPICRGHAGTLPTDGVRVCTTDCSAGQACPAGYLCQNAEPSGKACLVQVGSPDLCKFCTSGPECLSGICLNDGWHRWCSIPCQSAATCGPGYQCANLNQGSVCVPSPVAGAQGVKCPQPQCTTADQCAQGFDCVNGMCEPGGNIGDRCDVSRFCKKCGVCLGNDQDGYYCRPCCAGRTSGTGLCSGCPNAPCASDARCTMFTDGVNGVCLPETGAKTCEGCGPGMPCRSGLLCVSGRCRPSCNSATAGTATCEACIRLASGGGACTCPDEVRSEGESCAQGAGWCRAGYSCVGNPPVCRQPCTIGTLGTCPDGMKCTPAGTGAVCLPLQLGTLCGSCGEQNRCAEGLTCFRGKCQRPCDPASAQAACSTCTPTEEGSGICACEEQQISQPGQACGIVGTQFYACVQGANCVGTKCRRPCEGGAGCSSSEACVDGHCVPKTGTTGATTGTTGPTPSGTTDGSTSTDESTEGGTDGQAGCRCGSSPEVGLLAFAAVAWAAVRRRADGRPNGGPPHPGTSCGRAGRRRSGTGARKPARTLGR